MLPFSLVTEGATDLISDSLPADVLLSLLSTDSASPGSFTGSH